MTGITHAFTSAKSDGADSTVVQPSDWNAEHVVPSGYTLMRVATRTLTNAQIKALPSTAIELVAAPGAGKFVVPVFAVLSGNFSVNYTNIGDRCIILLVYPSTSPAMTALFDEPVDGNNGATQILAAGGATTGVMSMISIGPRSSEQGAYPSTIYDSATIANQALSLKIDNYNGAGFSNLGNLTGGDAANVMNVTVIYYVADL